MSAYSDYQNYRRIVSKLKDMKHAKSEAGYRPERLPKVWDNERGPSLPLGAEDRTDDQS